MELYNTGLDKAYSQNELSKLFNINKHDFLKSPDIPVIKRQFNWLPSSKGDPPRALTDPKPIPIVHYENVGVVSDFHKGFNGGPTGKMWQDGTYDDMKQKVSKDNAQLYSDVKFIPDYDFELRFNRIEQEQSLQSNISNYFLEKQQQKELNNRIILSEYGLNPQEVDKALAEKRISDAMKGLTDEKRHYVPNGARFEAKLREAVRTHKAEHPESMDLKTPRMIKEFTESSITPRRKIQNRIASEIERFNIQKTLAPLKDDTLAEIDAEPSTRYRERPVKRTEEEIKYHGVSIVKGKDISLPKTIRTLTIMRDTDTSVDSSKKTSSKKTGALTKAEKAKIEEEKKRGIQPTIEQMKGAGAGQY